ncbi:MAG: adenosylcobinamide amidohydrolase [Clostridium sp.]|uniref:adenosylcobinamide amidohydrolase n=1 Tax=Clostridium sp. TaxID=1506 RepID=UPI003020EEEF
MGMIYKLSTGDEIHRYKKSIVMQFNGKRKVLSTSVINGGYNEELKCVFNHDCNQGAGIACKLRAATYKEHMAIIARELGLEVDTTAGISTAASMENVAIKMESFRGISVTAIVTGGIEVNGGRVGDPASYYEVEGKYEQIKEGTINIILLIDANLPAETMVRALVTCTEAKTAAIQELMEGSKYSSGIATGSGTDGTILVSNAESDMKLTHAGKHSKLGELIGIAVKAAVKEALYLQTGLCPEGQHSVLRRVKRFGINEDSVWEKYVIIITKIMEDKTIPILKKASFIHNFHNVDGSKELVPLLSLYIHLIDQFNWGLLSGEQVVYESQIMLKTIMERFNINNSINIFSKNYENGFQDEVVEFVIDNFVIVMALIAGGIKDV